jgi:hypothetical protein
MKLFGQSMIVGALLCSTSAYANPPSWTISESSGPVNLLRPGVTEAGTRGKALKAGDVIATGKAGRAVLVRGGEYLVVSANSRIAIAQPKSGSMTQIVQSFGNAVFKIQKKATPHFAVQTPYLAAVVKGTTFSVTVEEGGASVQVTEGRVEVSTTDGGASHLVIPGEIGLVRSGMPGRLMIKGDDTKTIDSPTPPSAVVPASPVATEIAQANDPAADSAVAEQSVAAKIEEAIGEGAVDLAKVSDGMVTGNSTLIAMVTQPAPTPRISSTEAPEPSPAAEPAPAPAVDAPPASAVEPPTAQTGEQLPPAPVLVEVVEALPPAPVVEEISSPVPVLVADVAPLPASVTEEAPTVKEVEIALLIKDEGKGGAPDKSKDVEQDTGKNKDVDDDVKDKDNGNDKDKAKNDAVGNSNGNGNNFDTDDEDDDDAKGNGKGKSKDKDDDD